MKIAIIGCRNLSLENEQQIDNFLLDRFAQPPPLEVELITGGARGTDKLVEEFCRKEQIPCEIIKPINPSKGIDYLYRNVEILTKADKIIAFWDGKSRGTKFVIDYAKARNKQIEVISL